VHLLAFALGIRDVLLDLHVEEGGSAELVQREDALPEEVLVGRLRVIGGPRNGADQTPPRASPVGFQFLALWDCSYRHEIASRAIHWLRWSQWRSAAI
jgi:hypothetical protein